MLALLAIAGALVGSRLWFGGEDPVRGRPWYHEMLTWQAARDADWSTGEPDGARFDFGSPVIDALDPAAAEAAVPVEAGRPEQSSAAAALAWHADYLDSYLYNPLWWATGGLGRFRTAVLHRAELVKMHFDDLTSTRQVAATWDRVEQGTIAALLWLGSRRERLEPSDGVALARHVVGAGLHATQDFYSHSNWVDEPSRRTSTWLETDRSTREAYHLYSGGYEEPAAGVFKPHGKFALDCALLRQLPRDLMALVCGSALSPFGGTGLCERWRDCQQGVPGNPPVVLHPLVPPEVIVLAPPGIAIDSRWMSAVSIAQRDLPDAEAVTSDIVFLAGYRLAKRHSTQWLQRLGNVMAEHGLADFWSDVTTMERTGARQLPVSDDLAEIAGVYETDLQQWEEPWRSAFTFLSAGSYPPVPDSTEEDSWFVRLDVTTGGGAVSEDPLAGTDSIVSIGIDDHPRRPLDHRPGPDGHPIDPLIEHDDFVAGARDSYVVGPFPELPSRLVLYNAATPGAVDLVNAALWDFVELVSALEKAFMDAVLSLVGGKADRIGSQTRGFSWGDLVSWPPGVVHEETMRVDGGSEGVYDLRFELVIRPDVNALEVTFRGTSVRCVRESTTDIFSTSDEPLVQVMVTNAATGHRDAWQKGYNHVSTGSVRQLDIEQTFRVPRYGGVVLGVQMFESDLEGIAGRRDLYDQFVGTYQDRTEPGRLRFVDTLGSMIAPDWLLERVEVQAFRRSPAAELVTLVHDRQVHAWIEAGHELSIPLDHQLPSGPSAQGSTIRAGEVLRPGGALWSANGRYTFVYQHDGNVVLYGPPGALWDSATAGSAPGVLIMQTDGDLVLYNRDGHPFDTGTWGHPGASLQLRDDARVVLVVDGTEIFSTPTRIPDMTPASGDRLACGQGLYPGQALWSPSGRYALWYESAGDLVLHGPVGVVATLHRRVGRPGVFLLDDDGSMGVVEAGSDLAPLGAAGGLAQLVVQDDAKVALYAQGGIERWQSATGVPTGPTATSPYLRPGEVLYPDHGSISSPSGNHALVYQPDGNLVIYAHGGPALWGAGTENGPVGTVLFTDEGNLVVLAYGQPEPLFQSGTSSAGRDAFVMMRDDGKLTINVDDEVVWERPMS